MAALAPTSPFQWFGNGEVKSPEEARRLRAVAAALASSNRTPKDVGEGLSRVGDALLYRANMDRAANGEAAGLKSAAGEVAALGDNPDQASLTAALSDPWVADNPGQSAVVQALLSRHMQQSDPTYQLGIEKTMSDIALNNRKIGGTFQGDSMDAQAWNILQNADPSSKEYATAYSIVAQPKTQLVQTTNGMVPVQVPPALPGWLAAPGQASVPATAAPGPSAPADPALVPTPATPAPSAVPSAPAGAAPAVTTQPALPGTKQPATETQARNGAISQILLNEVPTLGKTFQALADPKGQLLNAIPAGLGNPWQSEEYQRAAASVKTSISNVLYSLSGASSNPGEVLKQIEVLTPSFGDKPGTITDKLNRFKTYVRSIASEANDPKLTSSVEAAIAQMDPATGSTDPAVEDLVKKYGH